MTDELKEALEQLDKDNTYVGLDREEYVLIGDLQTKVILRDIIQALRAELDQFKEQIVHSENLLLNYRDYVRRRWDEKERQLEEARGLLLRWLFKSHGENMGNYIESEILYKDTLWGLATTEEKQEAKDTASEQWPAEQTLYCILKKRITKPPQGEPAKRPKE